MLPGQLLSWVTPPRHPAQLLRCALPAQPLLSPRIKTTPKQLLVATTGLGMCLYSTHTPSVPCLLCHTTCSTTVLHRWDTVPFSSNHLRSNDTAHTSDQPGTQVKALLSLGKAKHTKPTVKLKATILAIVASKIKSFHPFTLSFLFLKKKLNEGLAPSLLALQQTPSALLHRLNN